MNRRHAFLIVLDGVGIGALPDAVEYGDTGANTLLHVAMKCGPLDAPNLGRLGLGNIIPLPGVDAAEKPAAAFGRMAERSAGKDTTAGHWEIGGVIVEKPFPRFPGGFPGAFIRRFEERIGRRVLGNRAASGTAILDELGAEQLRTGGVIVYTSADSVFQVAAHEEAVAVEELYSICETAREMLTGDLAVARVIARPFTGGEGGFVRSKTRRDYSLPPPGHTVFEAIGREGGVVRGIGKISDIYAGRGITESMKTKDNDGGVDLLLEAMICPEVTCAFVNLNDFDTLWGHRNDPESFGRGIEAFDRRLPEILDRRSEDDLLVITADHGNDPTTPGTDHSREYVPLLLLGPGIAAGRSLGTRRTFADVAATVAHHLDIPYRSPGTPAQKR